MIVACETDMQRQQGALFAYICLNLMKKIGICRNWIEK